MITSKKHQQFADLLQQHAAEIGKVIDFDPRRDKLFPFDFTAGNKNLAAKTVADTAAFSVWINTVLQQNNCNYGIGGYFENRTLYARSQHFSAGNEPRTLHLGVDIWAKAGTPIYTPFSGKIHSYADNDQFGDYGPTIILEYNFYGFTFFALYGHLSKKSLNHLFTGKPFTKNETIGFLGDETENGSWPPHLHYQLIFDMEGKFGDYPGVCKVADRTKFEQNIADPNLILAMHIQP